MYGVNSPAGYLGGRGFSVLPHAAYSCYDPCPTQVEIKVKNFRPFPFSTFWKRGQELFLTGARRNSDDINACLPPYVEGNCRFWWLFRAWGRDTIVADPGGGPVEFPHIGLAPRRTMLKMELIYVDSVNDQIRFVCDIGSGVVGQVGPCKRVQGYVVVPDVEAFVDAGGPAGPYAPDAYVAESEVYPSLSMGAPLGFRNLTFTQPLYLPAATPTWTFPVPAFASSVEVVADGAATVEFLLPSSVGGASLGSVSAAAGTPARAEVPALAADVRVTAAAPPTAATLVFNLEL